MFTDDPTKTSQLRIGGRCIGLVGNSEDEGADYEIQTCDDDNLKQLFRRNGLRWESGSNRDPVMCLDVTGSVGSDGSVLHQWECHDQPNQQWPDPTRAPSNLALLSVASLSSLYSSSYPASNLNDGNMNGSSFGHSAYQTNPSAGFVLPGSAQIDEVSIWNRTNCCSNRATNVWVFVSETPISNDLDTAKASAAASFNIPGQVRSPSTVIVNSPGTYAKVFIERTTYMNLAEIEIVGVQD